MFLSPKYGRIRLLHVYLLDTKNWLLQAVLVMGGDEYARNISRSFHAPGTSLCDAIGTGIAWNYLYGEMRRKDTYAIVDTKKPYSVLCLSESQISSLT